MSDVGWPTSFTGGTSRVAMFLVSLVSQGEQPERPEWHEQDSLQRLEARLKEQLKRIEVLWFGEGAVGWRVEGMFAIFARYAYKIWHLDFDDFMSFTFIFCSLAPCNAWLDKNPRHCRTPCIVTAAGS